VCVNIPQNTLEVFAQANTTHIPFRKYKILFLRFTTRMVKITIMLKNCKESKKKYCWDIA